MTYKAERLSELNKAKQSNAKIIRMKILGMILSGSTKKDIELALGCSQSTINRSYQNLSYEELIEMYSQHQHDFFSGVSVESLSLFAEAGFLYSRYRELLKKRELNRHIPASRKIIRPKPKFAPKTQEVAPEPVEKRQPATDTQSFIGEMPRQSVFQEKESFEERYKRIRRERREQERRSQALLGRGSYLGY